MQKDQLIDQVARQANLPTDRAEALTRATLRALAVRITGGEAEDLAAQLPADLDAELRGAEEAAQGLSFEEFRQKVQEQLDVDEDGSTEGVRAVFSVLSQAVTGGEFDDVVSHLPREFRTAVDVVE
ncbi:DUF2267 domain-containing protein [Saccharopolyspora rhizosphaerae]|uniref:DUF2267 domain-containing protein n=1 Tax=Saccharopolyspora rhizosphaerae TaxID=2492662 RepID=A0A426K031_9PSEU|nr:DUF2267 domain-containing protein [Saccharopolyspora rhizosphaerae]RRO18681.1 DUF2267 domain-containing protein [Saccharopolyspora rhizosphaerae]